MIKSTSTAPHEFSETLRAFDGEASAYRRAFHGISEEIPFSQMLLVSSFPRGGTQILQPAQGLDALLKLYSRELFLDDGPTWQAIVRNVPITGNDCAGMGSLESSDFYRQWMEPNGLRHVAAARVPGPVFNGYPGALHLYRSADEPAFRQDELRQLGTLARELGEAVQTTRKARAHHSCASLPAWEQESGCRQFIFDSRGQHVSLYDSAAPIDDRLKSEMRQRVTSWLADPDSAPTGDRVELPDSRGEMWAFRATYFPSFTALGSGPYVFLCLQPPACEWDSVRPTDFQADPELSRLIPTLKFMYQEFHRTPTLGEIAAKAHLSPFHFHRRFTELLGQTPKHFMLARQIQQAKKMLIERKIGLADIAADCGFAHQSHFTSRFKQATGLTPTRWRRLATEMEAAAMHEPSPGCAA